MKHSFLLTAAAVFSLTLSPSAMKIETHCEEDEHITMESDSLTEDYLYLGPELNFSGKARDLIFVGKQLSFSGSTELSLIGLGKSIRYHGETGNNLFAAGGSVVIDGKVSGNSFTAGRSVQFTEAASVNGTQFIACVKGEINCPVNGDLYAGAGKLVINSVVNGNVKLFGGRLIFGDNGKINGNLTYATKEELTGADSSRVTGTVSRNTKFKINTKAMLSEKNKMAMEAGFGIFMTISFVVISCLLLFLPLFGKLDVPQTERTYWRTALWGLIPVLMYPAVVVLSFALIVTIPFGIILLLACVPLFFIAYLIGTTLTGKFIVNRFKWNIVKRHYHFLIGALAVVIISVIPFINFLLFLFISSLGFGKLVSPLFGKDVASSNPEAVTQQ